MGFARYEIDGKYCPVVICDFCGKPIEKASSGIVALKEIVGPPFGYFHKGKCDPGVRVCRFSEELTVYLSNLNWNIHLGKRVYTVDKRQLIIDVPEEWE